jgi:hypothetical protein
MSTYHEYLKLGWPVFPIAGPVYARNPDIYKTWKEPLVYWQEFQSRLPTLDEIAIWEKRWPLAWIGCTTGPFSKLFVIDIDGEKGEESLASLGCLMPITKVAKTQRGFHYFFKWSAKMENYVTTKSGVKEGIDVRGKGGCIILPSSQSKRSWICDEFIAELPEAWYAHLEKNNGHTIDKDWRLKAMQDLNEGNRHDTFLRLASSLLNARWKSEEILAVLKPMADEQKFSEDIGALVADVVRRYSPEGRLMVLQTKTRRALSLMPVFTPSEMAYLKGTFPDLVHDAFAAQDVFNKESSAWITSDLYWQNSEVDKALSAWTRSVEHLKNCAVR